jgi:hypothetical protein
MDKKNLDKKLNDWIRNLPQEDRKGLLARLSGLKSVFPFNEYEYRLMFLLNKKVISFKEYNDLRNNYIKDNPYLGLYGLASRIFGGVWAENHLIDVDQRLIKASKKNLELKKLDPDFDGEYDLYILFQKGIIKIEVKASRAINTKIRETQESTALSYRSKEPFWMNFQQLKLDISDIFIFVGVWVDRIFYWVLTKDEVKNHPELSHQHRGGIEYQIGITEKNIKEFKKFLVEPTKLVETIKLKLKK